MEIDWIASIGLFFSHVFTPLASAASLVTAGIVIAAEIRRRRRVKSVMWDVTRIGFKVLEDGTRLNRVSLTNNGSETALVKIFVMCNSLLEEKMEEPLRWQFPPHQPQDITVDAKDPNDAWLFLGWVSADNRKSMKYCWVPLMPDSPLSEERAEQMTRRRMFLEVTKRLRGVTTPIGPGGQFGVKIGRRLLKENKLSDLTRLVTESKAQSYQK